MVTPCSEVVNDVLLEEKLVELWPDFPCLYDVRSTDFKNRELQNQPFEQIAEKLFFVTAIK